MDRTRTPGSQHSAAMRASRPAPLELLSGAGGRVGGEPGPDASDRRAVPADAVLRLAEHDDLADTTRARGQSQAGAASDADHGLGGDLSTAEYLAAVSDASNLPVFTARCGDSQAQPGLEHGHHLHPAGPRLRLP